MKLDVRDVVVYIAEVYISNRKTVAVYSYGTRSYQQI